MTAGTPHPFDPGIALSLACGRVLIGTAQDADIEALRAAIAAVPDVPSAARGLARIAAAWLAGDMDSRALAAALTVFNAPFCGGPPVGRRPCAPVPPGHDRPAHAATHAARVAQALED